MATEIPINDFVNALMNFFGNSAARISKISPDAGNQFNSLANMLASIYGNIRYNKQIRENIVEIELGATHGVKIVLKR